VNAIKTLNQLIQREQYMLNQYCHNLQAVIGRLSAKDNAPLEALSTLEKSLHGELSWAVAHRVELALVDYYDDITLVTEWHRRLAEIDSLSPRLMAFYTEQAAETDKAVLRSLLGRLVVDLQWIVESNRVIRFNESQMRKKVVALFLCAFILFFSPTIMRVFFALEFENLRLYYIFTAATSGILGAAFSQLTSIQARVQSASLDQVRAMSQMGYIVARAMVGAGAGLIMFYMVQSGLLSGAFFPVFIHTVEELVQYQQELALSTIELSKNTYGVSQKIEATIGVGTLARPGEGLSLLIVWCLLAGFSEKMIPGILNNKAKETVDSAAK
jgi:hypothetical protein